MARVLAIAALLVVIWCESSNAQTIAVFSDSVGQSGCIEVPEIPFLDLYVLFVPGGAINEMQGAEFRSVGFPSSWTILSMTPNSQASIVIGDPFDSSEYGNDCYISFSACQEGVVMLWKASILALPPVEDHALRIEPLPFCPGGHACWGPIVNMCDAPVYTRVILSSATSMVNPVEGCTVSIDSRSWGAVKQLYGD